MTFDPSTNLSAVERAVSLGEREGKPVRAVTLSRSFRATAPDLWDAVTNPERLPRWFAPVSGDLEAGGRYQVEGNAGGVITECERPSRFALTWEFGEDVSWVEVSVSDEGAGRARLTLTHTMRPSDHWDTYGPGATGVGWEFGFLGLALYLADPAAPRPDEAAFAASADGRAFGAGSSRGWERAAVAAGADPGAARMAAKRVTAFYTGEAAESA
ncbi:MAG: SRPBCC family protein [Acidobacteriota bacterium]|nr:SRPBCC family protein [Acidobacteriota bacterium]